MGENQWLPPRRGQGWVVWDGKVYVWLTVLPNLNASGSAIVEIWQLQTDGWKLSRPKSILDACLLESGGNLRGVMSLFDQSHTIKFMKYNIGFLLYDCLVELKCCFVTRDLTLRYVRETCTSLVVVIIIICYNFQSLINLYRGSFLRSTFFTEPYLGPILIVEIILNCGKFCCCQSDSILLF